ncbi:right-handed parallel beta-helix repeat-containing protein [Christiangramia salexigens]|uniref:Right handed beta helix domain-containing protein n=1 Tax=Christiangramia salexigens TaxID=1913577 RepID=A0A1L3J5B1_9FLAO|nr:right-handed parallel beta-helix repeat-containing protein [Christiangramia salexigens]APG60339.1 hypothetical protein LPB144_07940 [Christiangramia salexigens]
MKLTTILTGLILGLMILSCSPESRDNPKPPIITDTSVFYLSVDGNDNNSGNSPDEAWRTIAQLNKVDFKPGSQIFLEGGEVFEGNLAFNEKDGNDETKPIVITSYGSGKASIKADNGFGIYAYNTAGFVISNLIIQGSGKTTNDNSGINFYNDLSGDIKLSGITISDCEVSGFKDYGIVIGAWNGNSGFKDVIIANNKVYDILDTGIASYGFFSSTKTGYAHSNIEVKNCEVFDISGYDKPQHSGNGIVLSDVQNSVIEHSTVYDSGYNNTNCGGPVGIWYWDSDTVTIQNCEVYNMSSGTGCDGGGFDMDGGVTNGIMQYNYSHDNDGAGFMIGQFEGARAMNNITVRYNISENDAATNGGSVYIFNGDTGLDDIFVYNNTLYISEQSTNTNAAAIKLLKWKLIEGNIRFSNNILYTSNGADAVMVPAGYSASLTGNLYYSSSNLNIDYQGANYQTLEAFRATGNEVIEEMPSGYQGDPLLKDPGAGQTIGFGNTLDQLDAYKLENNSPAIDAGINITGSIGDSDFYGNPPLKNSRQNIGAHEI